MPILTVENQFHDRFLRKPTKLIKNFQDPELIILTKEMVKIASQPGVAGVAATQLGSNLRVFALQTNKKLPVMLFFNPKIVGLSEETHEVNEGCLSVPGKFSKLTRHKEVTMTWQDERGSKFDDAGNKYKFTFTGFMAQACLHELDHLSGVLTIDIADAVYDEQEFDMTQAPNIDTETLIKSMEKVFE